MPKRKGGLRRKSRRLLRKPLRTRGKMTLTRFLSTYKVGDTVMLVQEPSVQKGQFHLRFYGKTGTVVEKRGNAYGVEFRDGNKKKIIITHPVHLKRLS